MQWEVTEGACGVLKACEIYPDRVQHSLGEGENSHGLRPGSQRATYGGKPGRLLTLLAI